MDMQALFEKMADRWAEVGGMLEAKEISKIGMVLEASKNGTVIDVFKVSSMPSLFFSTVNALDSDKLDFLPIRPDPLVIVTESNGIETIISARAEAILRLVLGDL